jgi:DNA-binding NarL/FixJ family response regulator
MRILIVAGNAFAAEAIRRELRHASGCHVLGYVDARRPCALAVSQASPDVVLVDDAGDPQLVLARVREVRSGAPEAKVVLLTPRMDHGWLADASAAGIDAAVAKTVGSAALGLLVREVVAGNIFNSIAPVQRPSEAPAKDPGLTARELEILRLVASGGSNSSIAGHLWVAEQTVKFHLSNIYRKLGVANRTEASHYAHVHGLLEPAATTGAGADASLRIAA